MGRTSNRPPKSKKLARSHSSALREVHALIKYADHLPDVVKIMTGRIARGRSGSPICQFEEGSSQIKLTIHVRGQKQELFIHTNEPKDVGPLRTELQTFWQRKVAA